MHRVVHRGARRDRARGGPTPLHIPTCSSTCAGDTQRTERTEPAFMGWQRVESPLHKGSSLLYAVARRRLLPPPPDAWLKQGPHASGPLTLGSQGDHESAPRDGVALWRRRRDFPTGAVRRAQARPPPPDAWLKQGPHASGPLTRGSQGDHESAPGTESHSGDGGATSRPGPCDARKRVSNRGVGRAARGRSA